MSRLLELVAVMDRLRRECPWDREQTHRSLARYLLEETYETLEAIECHSGSHSESHSGSHSEGDDPAHLREELGDLLLQVVFHARIASERAPEDGGFDIEDVAGGIVEKLVHRHPHVFAGLDVADAAEVDRNWETLKAAEKQRTGLLDGIPPALPALAWADKVLGRLDRAGRAPALPGPGGPVGGPVGEELLALVVRARAEGLDAEQELRAAVRRIVGEPGEAGPDRALG
ncbi:MAG: Nucleoside triphosphate pyrophosphohydrolase MazG [uncultured Nocardioidaceae bacterium]|uniref:Nucleoside triphosphate pyrophosphohydrolase MazG n=1 Tax=uncultured Nocardioidaceae bacterium TaxID=253824 RepID=A0A6J4KUA4_9ACTN|nr:MAG: Nucleoside triphosphate pyrophosphohydrolase MazG [uncultured Nocardioidaceae bacterium]